MFTDTCIKWRVLEEILVRFFFFFFRRERVRLPLEILRTLWNWTWKKFPLDDWRYCTCALCKTFMGYFSLFLPSFPSLCSIERDCGKFCSSGVSHVALVCDSWTMEEKGKVMMSMVYVVRVRIKSSCETFWLLK